MNFWMGGGTKVLLAGVRPMALPLDLSRWLP